MTKRLIAMLLAAVMALSLVPVQAVHTHAAELDIAAVDRLSAEDFRLGQQCRFYSKPDMEVSPPGENETERDTTVASGVYGDNCQWFVDAVDGLFINCDGAMENQSSPQGYPWYTYKKYCTYIYIDAETVGDYAFDGYTALKQVQVDAGCTGIGSNAFRGCTNLEDVFFDGEALEIAADAFTGDSCWMVYHYGDTTWEPLVGQNFGGNLSWSCWVMTIGSGMLEDVEWAVYEDNTMYFYGVGGALKSFDSPEAYPWYSHAEDIEQVWFSDVTSVGSNAFRGYPALEAVFFDRKLNSIDSEAFRGCAVLEYVSFDGDAPALGQDAFADCPEFYLYYPEDNATWTPEVLAKFGIEPEPGEGGLPIIPMPGDELPEITLPEKADCSLTEEEVFARMDALREVLPEGMPFTNDDGYAWHGGHFSMGYGCAGFAFMLSDAAFGTLPARIVEEDLTIENLRVGDILRVNNNSHSVIVMEIYDDHIVIAEGNFNQSVHWGRVMTADSVASTTDYIMTRYTEHNWTGGSCTEPQLCTVCGQEGLITGHTWVEATCTAPKTCTACGYTESEAAGHQWEPATCTDPKTCTACGETEGDALGHTWQAATCTAVKTCTTCAATEGTLAEHSYENGVCAVCGRAQYAPSGSLETAAPTREQIIAAYQTVTGADSLFAVEPSVTAPYATGQLSDSLLESAITYLNFVRFVANLPAQQLSSTLNEDAQHGAVLMAANNILSHTPSKPGDMDDAFYNRGFAATSSSNIHYNFGYPPLKSMHIAVQSFMDDSGANNLAHVGHRRWILNPRLLNVGFGYAQSTGGANYVDMKVFDRSGEFFDYDFVAWPANNFPTALIDATVPWSVSLNPGKYKAPMLSEIQVTLTRRSDGKTWTFDSTTGSPVSNQKAYLTVDGQGMGEGCCIIFHPGAASVGTYSGVYEVRITGLKDANGQATELNYTADFFDMEAPHQHSYTAQVTEPTCTADGYTTYTCECGHSYTDGATAALGHSWQDATCEKAKTCARCGETDGEPLGHQWTDATCEKAKTCSVCGATEGAALGHQWDKATCTEPKTCTACGYSEGAAAGHTWEEATCDKPKTCSVCAATEGAALGHSWQDATCEKPKTCSVCGATEGAALSHSWQDATCEKPKTCSVCGATEGAALGHSWQDATCEKPKTCAACGATEGAAADHVWAGRTVTREPSYENPGECVYTCSVCKSTRTEEIPPLIGSFNKIRKEDFVVDRGYSVFDGVTGQEAVFDYDVPEDGVTMLIFFSAQCGYSQQMLAELAQKDWLGNIYLDVVAVEAASRSLEVLEDFAQKYTPDAGDQIEYFYSQNDGLLFDYFSMFAKSNTLYWPMVLIVTETDGVRTVQYGSDHATDMAALYYALCAASEGFEAYENKEEVPAGPTATVRTEGKSKYGDMAAILEQINLLRLAADRQPLILDEELTRLAMQRAAEIAVFYGDVRPDGTSVSALVNDSMGASVFLSENIAAQFDTAKRAMDHWLGYPELRSKMLAKEATHMGIGCVVIGGVTYWTQLFAKDLTGPAYVPDQEEATNRWEVVVLQDKLMLDKTSMPFKFSGDEAGLSIGSWIFKILYRNAGKNSLTYPLLPYQEEMELKDSSGNVIATVSYANNGEGGVHLKPVAAGKGKLQLPVYEGEAKPFNAEVDFHVHDYVLLRIVAPTCTEEGYSEYICGIYTCGHTKKDDVKPATGHFWQDATCQAPKTCLACNETEGKAADHSYEGGACRWCGKPEKDVTVKLGDVNGDGKINVTDAMVTLRYAVKKITKDELNVEAADVNSDGKVNVTDAMQILRFAVKKITEFKPAK